jgi:hypothetical protein
MRSCPGGNVGRGIVFWVSLARLPALGVSQAVSVGMVNSDSETGSMRCRRVGLNVHHQAGLDFDVVFAFFSGK